MKLRFTGFLHLIDPWWTLISMEPSIRPQNLIIKSQIWKWKTKNHCVIIRRSGVIGSFMNYRMMTIAKLVILDEASNWQSIKLNFIFMYFVQHEIPLFLAGVVKLDDGIQGSCGVVNVSVNGKRWGWLKESTVKHASSATAQWQTFPLHTWIHDTTTVIREKLEILLYTI